MSSNPLDIANLTKEQKEILLHLTNAPENPKDSSLQKKANEVVRQAVKEFVGDEGKAADIAKLEDYIRGQFEESRSPATGRLSTVQEEIMGKALDKAEVLFAQAAGIELTKGKPSYLC